VTESHHYFLENTVDLSFSELRELLTTIDQTDITELDLKSNNWELSIRKASHGVAAATVVPPTDTIIAQPMAVDAVPRLSIPTATPTPAAPAPPPMADSKLVEITSPMVGTFYRAPAPDEPPFVSEGDRISTNQTVCIIEAMKLMNELEAEVSGKIVEILVENSEPVEFGQVLMRVDPG